MESNAAVTTVHKPLNSPPPTNSPKEQTLPLKWLQPSKTNPRKQFDGPALDELVASIQRQGIIVPLIVRQIRGLDALEKSAILMSSGAGPLYEVVAGERRYRAATKLGLVDVPVRIRDLNDEEALEVQIVENLQRKDVSAIEEAQGFAVLLDSMAKAAPAAKRSDLVEQLAKRVGKAVRTVYTRMKLAELVPEVAKALEDGKLSTSHADEFVRLQPADQVKALKLCFEDKWDHGHVEKDAPVSVRTLKDRIQNGFYIDLKKATWPLLDATLVRAAGSCDECPKRAGVDGDGEKKSHCTDRACFNAKQQAFVQLRIDQQSSDEGGVRVVKLSWKHSSAKPKNSRDGDMEHISGLAPNQIFRRGQWVEAKRSECSTVIIGITVDEDKSWNGSGKPGTRKLVCVNPACKTHKKEYQRSGSSSSNNSGSNDSWEKQQAERKAREAKERPLRLVLVNKVVEQVQKMGPREIRFVIQTDCQVDFHSDDLHERFKFKGGKAVAERLDMLDPMGKEYAQIVIFAALADFLDPNAYNPEQIKNERKQLLAICELFGVKDAAKLVQAHDNSAPQTSAKSSPASPKAPAVKAPAVKKKSSPVKAKASSKKGGRK